MLEPATPNEILNRVQSPPPPVDVQGELEYEIAEVLDSKIGGLYCPPHIPSGSARIRVSLSGSEQI